MKGDDPLADYPQVRASLAIISKATDGFTSACEAAREFDQPVRTVTLLNALIELWIEFEKAANVGAGMETNTAGRNAKRTVAMQLRSIWPVRPLGLAECRALTVGNLYQDDIRFAGSGTQDSRMEAALLGASILEGLASNDPVGTIKKSISRLRRQVRGQVLCRLNLRQLRVEMVDAQTVMFAQLPSRRGRPRK